MNKLIISSALVFLLLLLSCGESAVSMMDPGSGHALSTPYDDPGQTEICHDNMTFLASACAMFYGVENRYPEELSELGSSGIYEDWDTPCPACGALYQYSTNSIGDTYSIYCPMPSDPTHGHVIDGICYWPPDTTNSQESCRSNMRCFGSAFAMFYGMENRYPEELSELGTSGIMENWDTPCPACGYLYNYSTDSTGQTYLIQCPLPWDPAHGFIEDGIISW